MTDVEYTEQALDHLEDLEDHVADRVLNKADEATEWTDHRLERLSGYPYYKLRAGDYRAIITWDKDEDVLIIEVVGHRRNVYDRHLPPKARGFLLAPAVDTSSPINHNVYMCGRYRTSHGETNIQR